ncbi:MAG: hypothetical protein H6Q07_1947, partial [Acidobacteria bacterium]|nr:hypothetical protein [Acidobacteriota bacterium]
SYGLEENALPVIAEKALKSSSMKPNPIQLTAEELIGVLMKAI